MVTSHSCIYSGSSVGECYDDLFDAGNPLSVVSAAHGVGPSSGYGASQVEPGPDVSASTSEAQANPR